jgi:hypothetical protein
VTIVVFMLGTDTSPENVGKDSEGTSSSLSVYVNKKSPIYEKGISIEVALPMSKWMQWHMHSEQ